MTPILLVGAGRMGGALIDGWRLTSAFGPNDLIIRDPHPGADALASGARVNPPDAALADAQTVLFAVKPQVWREAAATVAPLLPADAVVVSILAGVGLQDLAAAFARPVARVMPTTAVAIAKGVASIHASSPQAAARAHALFDPVATTVDLADEALLDVATAVSGSAPAYLYAFIEALEAAAVAHGLAQADAEALVRATVHGASTLMERSGEPPAELRRQVTSPGGTTQAALDVLTGPTGLPTLLDQAVAAAIARARALAA